MATLYYRHGGICLTDPGLTVRELVIEHLHTVGDFGYFDLSGLDLSHLDFTGSDFTGSNLQNTDFTGSNLTNTVLWGATLSKDTIMSPSMQQEYKEAIWSVFAMAPLEIPALLSALENGLISGSLYESHIYTAENKLLFCGCLKGTLEHSSYLKVGDYSKVKALLNTHDGHTLEECFFYAIWIRDTPATNKLSALAYEWATEFWTNYQEKGEVQI